uniref:Uncharacterized protein n=1 Tax=Amphimedon queenslandica TaxID=400682 RepID=A0A1X7V787_AMPQE
MCMVDINRSDVASKDSVIQSLQDDNLALRSELKEKEEVINDLLTSLNNVTYHPPSNTGKSIDESIIVKTRNSNELISIEFASPEISHHKSHGLINEVLYLLDAFNISDEFYHELSMLHPSLPRLCAVKTRRSNISSNVPILRLPKPHSGCYRSLKEYLAEILMKKVRDDHITSKVTVKISGDGAPFYRSSSYILLSFSLPFVDNNSLSSEENHTFAMLSGNEGYKTLKEGFAPVIDDINDLIEKSVIEVNGIDVTLDIIFGGDYKIVVDELHLLLRISDALIRNVVMAAMTADMRIHKDESKQTAKLLQLIRECGITFRVRNQINIWRSKDTKGEVQWTSLRGADTKKLLLKLPPFIPGIVPNNGPAIQQLWIDFGSIYAIITKLNVAGSEINELEKMTKRWINDFTSIPLDGHSKSNITPYMHLMVSHIPAMMRRYGSIKPFSGQGVEKNNDSARRSYFSSNHFDPSKEVLLSAARKEALSSTKRVKRGYRKLDKEYWSKEIFAKRRREEAEEEVDI